MAKHTIFLIHGMGKYGKTGDDLVYKPDLEGWFGQAKLSLNTIYDTHIKSTIGDGVAFEDRFRLVPIIYDSFFDRYRIAWAKQAGDWSKLKLDVLGMGLGDWIEPLRDFLSGSDEDDFGWTHAADVVLYCQPTIRDAVKNEVARVIAKELRTRPSTWSVIAHSLGTAVLHDTWYATIEALGGDAKSIISPTAVCSVANVAWALTQNENDAYNDALVPTYETNKFRPQHYINCNHRLDFIARLDPFKPNSHAWQSPDARKRFHDLSDLDAYYPDASLLDWKGTDLKDLLSLMPHGFAHYMAQPEVIATLWPIMLGLRPQKYYAALAENAHKLNNAKLKKDVSTALNKRVDAALDKVKGDNEVFRVLLPAIIDFVRGDL